MELPSPQVVQYGLSGKNNKHGHVIAYIDCLTSRQEYSIHMETLKAGKYGSLLAVTCTEH